MNIDENHITEYDVTEQESSTTASLLVSLLNDNAQHLNAVTAQRLMTARSLAVNKLAAQQTHALQINGNVLHWFGELFNQHRAMSSAMVASVMVLTFFAAQQMNFDNNLENSDAFLLASDLPPEAFADKGFDTWLVSKR